MGSSFKFRKGFKILVGIGSLLKRYKKDQAGLYEQERTFVPCTHVECDYRDHIFLRDKATRGKQSDHTGAW